VAGGEAAGDGSGAAPDLPSATEELARAQASPVVPITDLSDDHKQRYYEALISQLETRAKQAEDDRKLREKIADRVSWAAGAQVVTADLAFVVYGTANDWHIAGSTMSAWLAATVVQVIAVAIVIVKSLFRPDGSG
jgi:cation transport regulator ChaB